MPPPHGAPPDRDGPRSVVRAPAAGHGATAGLSRAGRWSGRDGTRTPLADGATACPFVAFEATATSGRPFPTIATAATPRRVRRRERCLSEAYCLSNAFVCPTFRTGPGGSPLAPAASLRRPDPRGAARRRWPRPAPPLAQGAASIDGPTEDTEPGRQPLSGEVVGAAASARDDVDPDDPPRDDASGDIRRRRRVARPGRAGRQRSPEPAPRLGGAPPAHPRTRRPIGRRRRAPPFLGDGRAGRRPRRQPADQLADGAPPAPSAGLERRRVDRRGGRGGTAAGRRRTARGSDDHVGFRKTTNQFRAGHARTTSTRRPRPDRTGNSRAARRPTGDQGHVGMPQVPRIVVPAASSPCSRSRLLPPGSSTSAGPALRRRERVTVGRCAESVAPTEQPAPRRVHTIKKGDTLLKVARRTG
jgi:hypothetical protein